MLLRKGTTIAKRTFGKLFSKNSIALDLKKSVIGFFPYNLKPFSKQMADSFNEKSTKIGWIRIEMLLRKGTTIAKTTFGKLFSKNSVALDLKKSVIGFFPYNLKLFSKQMAESFNEKSTKIGWIRIEILFRKGTTIAKTTFAKKQSLE